MRNLSAPATFSFLISHCKGERKRKKEKDHAELKRASNFLISHFSFLISLLCLSKKITPSSPITPLALTPSVSASWNIPARRNCKSFSAHAMPKSPFCISVRGAISFLQRISTALSFTPLSRASKHLLVPTW